VTEPVILGVVVIGSRRVAANATRGSIESTLDGRDNSSSMMTRSLSS